MLSAFADVLALCVPSVNKDCKNEGFRNAYCDRHQLLQQDVMGVQGSCLVLP
jgi:hypothetical protein